MVSNEIEKYRRLNSVAEDSGTVILGSGGDTRIPFSEIADSFGIETKFYNRSADELSITEAVEYYNSVVKALHPTRVILHIGYADLELFDRDEDFFDGEYLKLIEHIRKINNGCSIGIISLPNPEENPLISKLNRHLLMIAQAQRCEFEDIGKPRIWNPVETKYAMSFAESMGLSKKVSSNKSLYDLAKIFFGIGYECLG